MLMIFLMAVLSLNLIPLSTQSTNNKTLISSVRNGHGSPYQTHSKRFNMTIFSTVAPRTRARTTVTARSPATNETTLTPSTTITNTTTARSGISILHRPKAAPSTKSKKHSKKANSKGGEASEDHEMAHSIRHMTRVEKDLTPKSNMHVLQFYAHPLNSMELGVQPVETYNHYDPLSNANPISAVSHTQMFMAPANHETTGPTISTLPYKTIPDEYVNSAELVPKALVFKPVPYNPAIGIEKTMKPMPILDPYNLYRRNQKPRPIPVPVYPQRLMANVKPVSSPVSMLPPVSVTRVYKYTEGTGLKLPFLNNDDDDLPVLSAALDDHLSDRVTSLGIRNYLTPPRVAHPIYYNTPMGATVPPIGLGPGYRNEYQLLNKFNEDLRLGKHSSLEDDDKENVKENYNEEEVKKALEYIQHLKRSKLKLNRGQKKFKEESDEDDHPRPKKKKKKKKKKNEEEEEEEFEPELTSYRKKKPAKEEEYNFEEDDDFQVNPYYDDRNQEESRRKVVKTIKDGSMRSQESQIVPSVKEENTESQEFHGDMPVGLQNEGNERVEFQMHGLGGPESYKFGYDTGKGENRQFRYEERDSEGNVKGHFGYYDRDGKLQVFNYEADPEHGYHLEKAAEH